MKVLIQNTNEVLAHKVNGEHTASYSDLLLATQKLERTTADQ